jgi:hypothetical protein
MIPPTVGRVVWVRNYFSGQTEPLAAIVAEVHHERLVNVAVIEHSGQMCGWVRMPLVQEGDPIPEGTYCEWMPFQKGQAGKVDDMKPKIEALELTLAGHATLLEEFKKHISYLQSVASAQARNIEEMNSELLKLRPANY